MGHFKRHFGELLADFNKLNSVLNRNDYLKNSDTAAIALSSKFMKKTKLKMHVFICNQIKFRRTKLMK